MEDWGQFIDFGDAVLFCGSILVGKWLRHLLAWVNILRIQFSGDSPILVGHLGE